MENKLNHPLRQSASKPKRREASRLTGFFALTLLWLGPILACGSFQPREAPTATPLEVGAQPPPDSNAQPATTPRTNATPLPEVPTATLPPLPTATFTATPQPGTALRSGQPGRITAPNGLNMRQQPTSGSSLVLQLGRGQLVTILDGPRDTEGFTWWQVEDQQSNRGWVADGDSETVWLSPDVGEPQPVGRAPRVGDRVRVTMEGDLQLTIRALPGTDGPLIARVNAGTEFTIVNGPQNADGYSWYQIRSDDGALLGWAADSDAQKEDRWLSPIE